MTIIDQFDLKAAKFNFSRDYFESVDLLNKAPITNFPDHFITNVAGTLYQLTKANGVWDDSKKTWTVSPWKKLEFGDKNALTTDSNGKIQKNGVNVNKLTVTNGNTTVNIEAKSGETDGILVSSFGSGRPGTVILNGEGLKQYTGGSHTEVWTTDGGTVNISGLPPEGAVAAIQAKLAGIDDTVKGYVDSQVKGLTQALVFKGSVSQGSDLPDNPKVGDTYVINAIGEYAGETCEVGDTIICTVAKSDETAAQWLVVQKNINGAVTKGDAQTWKGKLLVGGDGNSISILRGESGYIIQADVNGNPTYVEPKYASTDDANLLDSKITITANAAAAANEKAVNAAKKANDASGAAEAANRAAAAAQATADEAKAGLKNKAGKDEATADAAGLMSAADKSKLDRLSEELQDFGAEVANVSNTVSSLSASAVQSASAAAESNYVKATVSKSGTALTVGATATIQPMATASAETSAPKKGLAETSDVKTYVDKEVAKAKQAGTDASAKVDTAIAALNATVTSDDAAVAKVKVVEANGKITDVVVTNFGAGVAHTTATESAEANLTATTATGAVVGSDIAKIKSYVDEKSTIVSISETEITDLFK